LLTAFYDRRTFTATPVANLLDAVPVSYRGKRHVAAIAAARRTVFFYDVVEPSVAAEGSPALKQSAEPDLDAGGQPMSLTVLLADGSFAVGRPDRIQLTQGAHEGLKPLTSDQLMQYSQANGHVGERELGTAPAELFALDPDSRWMLVATAAAGAAPSTAALSGPPSPYGNTFVYLNTFLKPGSSQGSIPTVIQQVRVYGPAETGILGIGAVGGETPLVIARADGSVCWLGFALADPKDTNSEHILNYRLVERSITRFDAAPKAMAFDPTSRLAAFAHGAKVSLWKSRDYGSFAATSSAAVKDPQKRTDNSGISPVVRLPGEIDARAGVRALALGAQGSILFTGTADQMVRAFDTATGELLAEYHADGFPFRLAFDPAGRFLLAAVGGKARFRVGQDENMDDRGSKLQVWPMPAAAARPGSGPRR